MTRARRSETGVILIALLWILVAISAIALSFSRDSHVEVAAARNSRDLTLAYYAARAGIMSAIYQLWDKRLNPPVRGIELPSEPNPIDLGQISGKLGDGLYEVEIQDESGKINVNSAPEEQIRQLMEVLGIEKTEADTITDSILDWRDPDNLHRINGAEDDYYQSLERPYRAKNGRLDTVEELLLVRGVTPEYFYGYPETAPDGTPQYRYGLSRYLTVYSPSININVNHAPLAVLQSVPGLSPDAALMIYQRRLVKPFQDLNEITKELPVTLAAQTMPFLSTRDTGTYTLTAYGQREFSNVRRVIRSVVALDVREKNRYRIFYWNENVPNL